MRWILLGALLALAACSDGDSGNVANATVNTPAPSPTPVPPEPQARAVAETDTNAYLSWSLAYPREVAAIPKLAEQIRAASMKEKSENLATAKSDKAERAKENFPFNAYEQKDDWSIAGMTDRLLSLADEWFLFTGGAHPNHGTRALLWDKVLGKEIAIADLLPNGLNGLGVVYRNAYCKALDRVRASKRQGEDWVKDPDNPFDQCPKLEELAIIPKGPDKGGPMTVLLFHADPYVAGAYAEGDYDIELPVNPDFIAALKPEYRASFSADP